MPKYLMPYLDRSCPRCKAPKGKPCVTAARKKVTMPHFDRMFRKGARRA